MRTETCQAEPFPVPALGCSMREIASREAFLPVCGNAELSALDRGAEQQSGIHLRLLRIVEAKHKAYLVHITRISYIQEFSRSKMQLFRIWS